MDHSYSEDIFRLLLEQISEGVILSDPDGKIVFVNSAAESIRNIDRDHILGHNILDCHAETSRTKVTRAMDYLRSHSDKSYHRMVEDGENNKIYKNTYSGVFDGNGEMAGMAVITRDITESRKKDEDIANSQRTHDIVLENLKQQYQILLMNSMEVLSNILEAKDTYTNGHSKRVAKIASQLYEYRYGIDQNYFDIQWAAKLHDIGKICIPDYILNKTEKLTKDEFQTIRQHSSIASDILKSLDPGDHITSSVRHHHERFDGSGYPDKLSGINIPLGARIICVADSYDAMRSSRPYRKAMDFEICIDEMQKNSGTQFDPEWIDVFQDLALTGSID